MEPQQSRQQKEAAAVFRSQEAQRTAFRDEKPPARGAPLSVHQYGLDGRVESSNSRNLMHRSPLAQSQREMVPQLLQQQASGSYRAFQSPNETHSAAQKQLYDSHQHLAQLEAQRRVQMQMQQQQMPGDYRALQSQTVNPSAVQQQLYDIYLHQVQMQMQQQQMPGNYRALYSQTANHSAAQQQSYDNQHLAFDARTEAQWQKDAKASSIVIPNAHAVERQMTQPQFEALSNLEARRRPAILMARAEQDILGNYASRLNQSLQSPGQISGRNQRQDALIHSDQQPTDDLRNPLTTRGPPQNKPETMINAALLEDGDDKAEEQTANEACEHPGRALDSSYYPQKQTWVG